MRTKLIGIFAGLALAACTTGVEPQQQGSHSRTVSTAPASTSTLLAWGSGPSQVGLQPHQREQLAQGVSAVAVGPDGAAHLLDRLNQRVLRLVPGAAAARVFAQAPRDAEDLAAGPDGALAAHSPLRATVWIIDHQGEPAGQLAVPRLFHQLQGVGLGRSRVVTLHVAHQETYRLGSPTAVLALEAMLHSKREGAYLLADGSGVATRLTEKGKPRLLLLQQGPRTRVVRRHALGPRALAARVVGVSGRAACVRLERQDPHQPRLVQREAICLDLHSGQRLLQRRLPAAGLYLPRRELAMGGTPPRLVLISPQQDGLRVTSWAVLGDTQGRQP